MLAASTVFVDRPIATDSQDSAKLVMARTPIAASHSTGFASGRKPTSRATATTSVRPTIVWITAPTTCPVSTDARAIDMVRNRAMMPSVMSMAIAIAVPCAPPVMARTRMPGTT